jgi:DNA-binding transcriptional LysR family regulator
MTWPDLNLLAAFDSLYQARSVTVAAARHGIGQPAMSAQLARLRRLYADELFVRVGSGLQPTPKAEAIAPGIAAALASLRASLADAAPFQPATATRRFSIAASDYATLAVLPPLVAALRQQAPGVRLRVLSFTKAEAGALLDRDEVDLVLGTFRDPPPRAVATPLLRERFIGIARHGHPALRDGAVTLQAYLSHPHALFTIGADLQGEIDAVLARSGRSRQVVLGVAHLLTLPALLAGTDLLAAVPSRLAPALAAGMVATFALPVPTETWRLTMLWNPATRRDPARAWLRGLVRGAAAQA